MTDELFPQPAISFALSMIESDEKIAVGLFHEVSGIETEIETEPLTEGGENQFQHRLPQGHQHGNLRCRRGEIVDGGPLHKWCRDTLERGLSTRIETKSLVIELHDETGVAVAQWAVTNAYPVKWNLQQDAAPQDRMLVGEIEFAYDRVERKGI